MAQMMRARPARPPTTPPAMAPTLGDGDGARTADDVDGDVEVEGGRIVVEGGRIGTEGELLAGGEYELIVEIVVLVAAADNVVLVAAADKAVV